MKHAIYQMEIVSGKPAENRNKVEKWVQQVVKDEAVDVILLPEMWTTGYTLDQLEDIADENGEPTTTFLQQLAHKYNVIIVGGSYANKKNGKVYNTSTVIDRTGKTVYEYDKMHLVPMLNEPAYLEGGKEKARVFEVEGVKMGLIICYDLRFPELARSLALEGAEVLYVTAEWPTVRKDHWKNLLIARAIENQMFVVASNCPGSTDGSAFAGMSMMIDPWGNVLEEGKEEVEETVIGQLDMTLVQKTRTEVPVFESRVPHLYQ